MSDGRLWHGEHGWVRWVDFVDEYNDVSDDDIPNGIDDDVRELEIMEKIRKAEEVDFELDLQNGKLTASVGDMKCVMASGLSSVADREGGFCWCAEMAGEGDSVSVAWWAESDPAP